VPFILPAFKVRPSWRCVIDTFDAAREGQTVAGSDSYLLADHSVAVFVMEPA
jgi:hypothetical protein